MRISKKKSQPSTYMEMTGRRKEELFPQNFTVNAKEIEVNGKAR